VKPIRWPDLLEAGSDFRRTWPQLLLTDLLARIIVVVVLTPMVGILIKVFLLRADDGVLTDTDIVVFLIHPLGITALLIVCSVSLGVWFAKQGFMMVVGFGAVEDRRMTWLDSVRYVTRYAFELVKLAGHVIVRLLLISAPFLAGVGGVYLLFLNKHDINFYLVDKPPELWWAIAIAGLLMMIMAVIVLKKCASWIIAMPLILFEGNRARQALRESARKVVVFGWKISLLLASWLAGVALLSGLVTFLVGLIGNALIPDFGGNFAIVASGLGITLMLAGFGNLAIAILSTALFPLLIVRLYRSLASPGRLDPELAARGSLAEKASLQIPGKAIFGLSAAVLALIILGGYAVSRSIDEEADVEIIAHRGASGAAPENTMASFQRAIVDKADWIELDVQENADDVIVVVHDSDFLKVARSNLKVWNATNESLRDLDIGSWYASEYSNQRVPTLRQALELAKDKLGVVIELKYYGHDRNLESRVADIVEQTGMESDIMIMSLKIDGLRKVVALRPAWTRGLLNTASIGDLTRLDLNFLALNSMAASTAMIHRAHKQGMKVFVWTVNDPVQMSVMMSRGVDGIITDEPALAHQVMELRKQLSPFGRLVVWIAGETGLLQGVDKFSTEEDA
jgi:glycerophosphoryl diester phosphodiesterase